MHDFFFARSQMAMSLAFHIIFASLGIGMPVLMVLAEGMHLRTGEEVYLDLSRRWARGTAILFAVGAVSGTVLSFELGLLWPKFMDQAGAIIGMPFSLEGFAFFTEAIFIGVYFYGWKRLSPVLHWIAGLTVAVSGVLSGIFVVTANAWMNAPAGFDLVDGKITHINPVAAMLNPAAAHEVIHMTLAALVATGFAVAAVHAFFLRRDKTSLFHRRALSLALALGCGSIPLQMLSGDNSARAVARLQPAKLAAMEAHYKTGPNAPILIGGIPDSETQTTTYAVPIPDGLSLLLKGNPDATVTGLDAFPKEDWPNVRIVHWAFDIMVGTGTALMALAVWVGWSFWWRKRLAENPWLLRALVAAGPLGFVAIESGWAVTESGRQPWVIYNVLRTKDAVTPMPGLVAPFAVFALLYIFLGGMVFLLLRRQFLQAPGEALNSEPPPEDE
jgi:cytochrome d ubiquinol oxidase subunit I